MSESETSFSLEAVGVIRGGGGGGKAGTREGGKGGEEERASKKGRRTLYSTVPIKNNNS